MIFRNLPSIHYSTYLPGIIQIYHAFSGPGFFKQLAYCEKAATMLYFLLEFTWMSHGRKKFRFYLYTGK